MQWHCRFLLKVNRSSPNHISTFRTRVRASCSERTIFKAEFIWESLTFVHKLDLHTQKKVEETNFCLWKSFFTWYYEKTLHCSFHTSRIGLEPPHPIVTISSRSHGSCQGCHIHVEVGLAPTHFFNTPTFHTVPLYTFCQSQDVNEEFQSSPNNQKVLIF